METLYSTCCSSNYDQTKSGNQNIIHHSMLAFVNVTELHETLVESYNCQFLLELGGGLHPLSNV